MTAITITLAFRAVLTAVVAAAAPLLAGDRPPGQSNPQKPGDLDAFMARVLERRDEGWRRLHDFVLSEREAFELTGPGGARLDGARREFAWYVRDGYLIRSPVRFDGVEIGEAERRKYEEKWLAEEKAREARRGRPNERVTVDLGQGEVRSERRPESGVGHDTRSEGPPPDAVASERGEPRFVSEAFFLKFKFEPGNYYLVGREQIEGREVLRIEYYPTRLYRDQRDDPPSEQKRQQPPRGRKGEADLEQRIQRNLNKVALVTLWVDPSEHQIVRYEFDNVDFGFLPARWLFRLDTVTGTMTMARVLDDVWLPSRIEMRGAVTLAPGGYALRYAREFHDYKRAETSARVRSYGSPDR